MMEAAVLNLASLSKSFTDPQIDSQIVSWFQDHDKKKIRNYYRHIRDLQLDDCGRNSGDLALTRRNWIWKGNCERLQQNEFGMLSHTIEGSM